MTNVRESMRSLPRFVQPALTWITGKPLVGQRPIFRSNSFTQTFSALVSLFGGAAYGFWVISSLPVWAWVALIPGWLFVAGAARKIQVTLVHQCSHFNFTGSRAGDRIAAQALSTLVMTDHFDSYFHEHIRVHHTRRLSTEVDPDCRFLLHLGFRPGMNEAELRANLRKTVFSPAFHANFLLSRLKSNFVSAPLGRRFASVAYHGTWIAFVAAHGAWAAYALAWWFPLTFVYHVAALLNFSSLHVWLKPEDPRESAKERLCGLTYARFLGEAFPARAGSKASLRRIRWALRMLLVHLPARVAVLSGDLPVHDYHHRYPRCADWANFIYTRQRDEERDCPGWKIPYRECWGLSQAIGEVFRNLSRLEPRADEFPTPGAGSETAMLAQI